MLFKEIISVCTENHTEHINKNAQLLIVEVAVDVVTIRL
jgi:hypothetical protein